MLKFLGILFLLCVLYLAHGITIELAVRKLQNETRKNITFKDFENIIFWPKRII
jgi:hypothetical protein